MNRRHFLALTAGLSLGARAAGAFLPRAPIRGTIVSVDGPNLLLAGRDGESIRVTLLPGAKVVALRRLGGFEEIEPGRLVRMDVAEPSENVLRHVGQIHVLERSSDLAEGQQPFEGYFFVTGRVTGLTDALPPRLAITVGGTSKLVEMSAVTQIILRNDAERSLLTPGTAVRFTVSDESHGPSAWSVDVLYVELNEAILLW